MKHSSVQERLPNKQFPPFLPYEIIKKKQANSLNNLNSGACLTHTRPMLHSYKTLCTIR